MNLRPQSRPHEGLDTATHHHAGPSAVPALAGIGLYPSALAIGFLGFVASGTIGFFIPVLYTMTGEHFPTRVRATGVALSDGVGHLGGAFCGPIILGAESIYGFQGAFLTMAATGLMTAVLVGFLRDKTGTTLD